MKLLLAVDFAALVDFAASPLSDVPADDVRAALDVGIGTEGWLVIDDSVLSSDTVSSSDVVLLVVDAAGAVVVSSPIFLDVSPSDVVSLIPDGR